MTEESRGGSVTNTPAARILADPNPSLKRVAWAYGCAKKGSREEEMLWELLKRKVEEMAERATTDTMYKYVPEAWARFVWDSVVLGGIGEDRERSGITYTYVPIDDDLCDRFATLSARRGLGQYLMMWEDTSGFVHATTVNSIPESSDEDLGEAAKVESARNLLR